MVDQQHRHPRTRDRRVRVDSPPRCKPTLFARFVNERLVALEHRHIMRRPQAEDVGRYLTEAQRAARVRDLPPADAGCRGACVGQRDVLPLSYLTDKGADHDEVVPQ